MCPRDGRRGAVFILNCPDGPPDLRESYGFDRSDVARIGAGLVGRLATLCSKWMDIHGRY